VHDRANARPAVLNPEQIATQVAAALHEDVGSGDVTARLVPAAQSARGTVVTREETVLCGRAWAVETFRQLDAAIQLKWHADDGECLRAGQVVFEMDGAARSLLTGERTALNFLQLLSATATETRRYVDAVAGTGCTILDTRKTLPGLRLAQKYAVRCGGARNHRLGLYDMVLIKENHIATAGSVSTAVAAARSSAPEIRIEIEVESLAEFDEALAAAPDIVMLDDFTLADMRTAVQRAKGKSVQLEASGGVNLQTVREIAATGVDYISVGALTKNIRAIDLSLRLEFA
jgi:nicotinate-nucleotide pyrophosphorylase (carboxylating)